MTENYHVIRDTVEPTISMSDVTITTTEAASYNLMTGVSVADNSGVTPTVTTSGSLSSTPGTYTITYTVRDAAGNSITRQRLIYVTGKTISEVVQELNWCDYAGTLYIRGDVSNSNINFMLNGVPLELYTKKGDVYVFATAFQTVEVSWYCDNQYPYDSKIPYEQLETEIKKDPLVQQLGSENWKYVTYTSSPAPSQNEGNTCGERTGNGMGYQNHAMNVFRWLEEIKGNGLKKCNISYHELHLDNLYNRHGSVITNPANVTPWIEIPEDDFFVTSGNGNRGNPFILTRR